MIFAIADKDGAVFFDENAVRAGEFAIRWSIAIGAVSTTTVADDDIDDATFHVDHSNGVRFGIGKIHIPCGIKRDAFWSR